MKSKILTEIDALERKKKGLRPGTLLDYLITRIATLKDVLNWMQQ
jgi:hypothetical protein